MDASEENRMNESQKPAEARVQMKIIVMFVLLPWLASSSTRSAEPQTNWSNNCVQCHGQDGSANTPMGKVLSAKNLRSAEVQASFTDAEAVEVARALVAAKPLCTVEIWQDSRLVRKNIWPSAPCRRPESPLKTN